MNLSHRVVFTSFTSSLTTCSLIFIASVLIANCTDSIFILSSLANDTTSKSPLVYCDVISSIFSSIFFVYFEVSLLSVLVPYLSKFEPSPNWFTPLTKLLVPFFNPSAPVCISLIPFTSSLLPVFKPLVPFSISSIPLTNCLLPSTNAPIPVYSSSEPLVIAPILLANSPLPLLINFAPP